MRCVLLSESMDLRAFLGAQIERLNPLIEVVDFDRANAAGIELALAWNPPADAFSVLPDLRIACSPGAGADSILTCPSLPAGVDVIRTMDPDQAKAMSAFAIWHVIWHQRKMGAYLASQSKREWHRPGYRSARETRVGVLGYGAMGKQVADDLTRLGFPVSVWSRRAPQTSPGVTGYSGPQGLREMLATSEVLINLLPLTDETRGLLNRDTLSLLPRGAYLVHLGRGEQLVEADLLALLQEGHIAGASLDVFNIEPLPQDHPFWTHPSIVVTPHDACDVTPRAVADALLAAREAVQQGRTPIGLVDRMSGY